MIILYECIINFICVNSLYTHIYIYFSYFLLFHIARCDKYVFRKKKKYDNIFIVHKRKISCNNNRFQLNPSMPEQSEVHHTITNR